MRRSGSWRTVICVENTDSSNCSQHANALARHAGSDICLQQAWLLRTSSLALLLRYQSVHPYSQINPLTLSTLMSTVHCFVVARTQCSSLASCALAISDTSVSCYKKWVALHNYHPLPSPQFLKQDYTLVNASALLVYLLQSCLITVHEGAEQ